MEGSIQKASYWKADLDFQKIAKFIIHKLRTVWLNTPNVKVLTACEKLAGKGSSLVFPCCANTEQHIYDVLRYT